MTALPSPWASRSRLGASCCLRVGGARPTRAAMSAGKLSYTGSRCLKQRHQYSTNSRCGFAELRPGCVMSGRELFDALRNVDGVRKVDWLTATWAQENVLVWSEQGGRHPTMEFAVTRHQHMKDPDAPKTVTVMFKEPSLDLHAEAWWILRAVVRVKELLPVRVQKYMVESLARRSGFLAPGSASAFSAAGSSAVAGPAAPANPAANDLPQDGSTKYVEMAGATTLPTSPNAAAPPAEGLVRRPSSGGCAQRLPPISMACRRECMRARR